MPIEPRPKHKNRRRAPLRPLDAPTLTLSVFGLGFLRPAPGTWGSLPPVGLALILPQVTPPGALMATLIFVLIGSCALCVVWGTYGEVRFGRKDAAEVVIDETAGQCFPLIVVASLMMLPATNWYRMNSLLVNAVDMPWNFLLLTILAFFLFRACDILKPWPARGLESLPHGWGVLMDDVMAGIYAAIVLALVVLIPG